QFGHGHTALIVHGASLPKTSGFNCMERSGWRQTDLSSSRMLHWLRTTQPAKILFLIIGLNLLFSLPGLWVPYFNIDEVTNAIVAKFMNRSLLGLNDFIGDTYFLTHYLYAAMDRLFGLTSLMPIHLFHTVWKTMTILAAYLLGREAMGQRA